MRLVLVLVASGIAFACGPPARAPDGREKTETCAVESKVGVPCRIDETTNPQIGTHEVGVSNLFDRELPGPDGVVAMRKGAAISVYDRETKKEEHHKVTIGTVIPIGNTSYRVVAIEYGHVGPGWIILERIP